MLKGNAPEEVVTGTLVLLQAYFKECPDKNLVWDPDDSVSKILITDQKIDDVNQKPHIWVERKGVGWGGVFNDKFIQNKPVQMKDGRWAEGKMYSDILQGQMAIHCLHRGHYESAMVGNKVFMYLTVFSPVVRRKFFNIDNITQSETTMVVSKENIKHDTIIGFTFAHNVSWVITDDMEETFAKMYLDLCTGVAVDFNFEIENKKQED